MGIFDKLAFWKKEDDPFSDLDKPDPGLGGQPGQHNTQPQSNQNLFGSSPFSEGQKSDPFSSNRGPPNTDNQFPEQQMQKQQPDPGDRSFHSMHQNQKLPGKSESYQQSPNTSSQHNTELILSKLDTIKLNIDNINLRISKIENELRQKKKKESSW